ncbi:MAG TPA: substrate-binding domain-containing protein [Actinomycetota bacterium]|nr:substrate-binding domain-containing protein [Actinomycetota bacterium]
MTRVTGRPSRLLLLGLVLALFAVACGGDDNGGAGAAPSGGEDGEELSGEIFISGSSTVEPISRLNAELFMESNGGVSIDVEGPGTGDGFEKFCSGESDISDASRPIDAEEEIPACEENGVEFIELKVGIDGIAVITNPDNEIECLDFKDLYTLLGPESQGIETWSDAVELGEEVGAAHADAYPDAPLEITAPGEESGTYDSFAELVTEGIAVDERGQSEDGPFIRPDYSASADDNVIIEGVSGSEGSLGWVGYSFFVQNEDRVRAIPIAEEGDDCIEPTEDSISTAEYPISRFLYIYVNSEKVEENAALEAFIDFYVSEDGLAAVTDENVGYVSLADEDIGTLQQVWEDKETGSREAEG